MQMFTWLKSLFGFKTESSQDKHGENEHSEDEHSENEHSQDTTQQKAKNKSHKRSHSKRVRDHERELRRKQTGQKGDWKKFWTKGGGMGVCWTSPCFCI